MTLGDDFDKGIDKLNRALSKSGSFNDAFNRGAASKSVGQPNSQAPAYLDYRDPNTPSDPDSEIGVMLIELVIVFFCWAAFMIARALLFAGYPFASGDCWGGEMCAANVAKNQAEFLYYFSPSGMWVGGWIATTLAIFALIAIFKQLPKPK